MWGGSRGFARQGLYAAEEGVEEGVFFWGRSGGGLV